MKRRSFRRLDSYLFREVAVPFLAAQCIMAVLFLSTEALTEAVKLITRQGLPPFAVLKLILFRFPWAIGWTIPMSTGMAVVLAFGRLCRDTEYTAMVVGGLSYRRMMVPVLLFAGLISAVGVWVQEWLGPAGMQAYETGKMGLIKATSAQLREVHMRLNPLSEPDRITLTAESLDMRTDTLNELELNVYRRREKMLSVYAKNAHWNEDTGQWLLRQGYVAAAIDKEMTRFWNFDAWTVTDIVRVLEEQGLNTGLVFNKSPREIEVESTNKTDYLTYHQIRQRIQADIDAGKQPNDIGRVQMYLHRRWTLGTSSFLFALIGAPLAVRPQRGASLGGAFAIGMALVMGYYISWNATTAIAERGVMPELWAWSTSIVGLVAGLFLTRRVID